MNYVILIGIALFFVLTAIRDGARGWDFNNQPMNIRIGGRVGDYSLSVKSDGAVDLDPDGSGVTALDRGGSFDVRMRRDGVDRRALYTSDDGTIERQFFVEGGPRRHLRVVDFDERRANVEVRGHVVRRQLHEPLEVRGSNRRRVRVLHRIDALREVGFDERDLVEQAVLAASVDEPCDALVGVDRRLA